MKTTTTVAEQRIFNKPNDAINYLKEHENITRIQYKCPTCGHVRDLTRSYVIYGGFRKYKYSHCLKCADRKTDKPKPGKIMVKCSRCRKARWVMQETFDRGSYGKYCQTCLAVLRRKNENAKTFSDKALVNLHKNATPIRDQQKPCDTREYFCLHYGKCLNYCIAMKWPGFSCLECTSVEFEPMEQRMLPWSTIMELMPSMWI